jgi:hypothetical protein
VCKEESEIKRVFKNGLAFKEGHEVEPVPNITRWLENALRGQYTSHAFQYPYPLFFDRSRKIIRLYEILNNSTKNSSIHEGLFSNITHVQTDFPSIDSLIFNKMGLQQFDCVDYRDYLKPDKPTQEGCYTNLHLFEKLLFTLKEEHLSLEDLRKLPSIVSLPILEIIRYSRLHQ